MDPETGAIVDVYTINLIYGDNPYLESEETEEVTEEAVVEE